VSTSGDLSQQIILYSTFTHIPKSYNQLHTSDRYVEVIGTSNDKNIVVIIRVSHSGGITLLVSGYLVFYSKR